MMMGRIESRTPAGRRITASPRVLGYRCFQVLNYINLTVASEGIAPSYDMICDELGISNRSKVSDIVKRLERRGLLSRVGVFRCPRGTNTRNIRRIVLGVALSGTSKPLSNSA